MDTTTQIDPAIRGRDYRINFRHLTPAELAERHKARAEDEARAAVDRLKPDGRPFQIDPGYERTEAGRRSDEFTAWDTIKYGSAVVLLPLLALAGVGLFLWSWLA